jgi:hypothetical protein
MADSTLPDENQTPRTTSQDINRDEDRGHSSEQKKALRRCEDAREISAEYCRPFFDKFVRLIELYSGDVPDELDCTHAKVMLRIAFSIVQNEIPRSAASVLSTSEFFDLEANDKSLEYAKDAAREWLLYQARKKNRIFPRILPTLGRVGIMGNAYRAVTHTPIVRKHETREPSGSFAGIPFGYETKVKTTQEMGIVSQNIDTFSIMPSPNGTVINPLDPETQEGLEYLLWIDYFSKRRLKALQKKKYANAEEIQRMLDRGVRPHSDPHQIDAEYRERARSATIDDSQPDWIQEIRLRKTNLDARFRGVWHFFRDEWILLGEDRHLIYQGPPLLDWFPVAHYVETPGLNTFFGVGLVEACEDVILSYLLNYNFRMDYLAGTLHPTKFVRDDIVKMNGANVVDFDPTPYGMFKFPAKVRDIQKAIWYDRFPEISPQAFMEETNFRQLLQEISSQPNYMKGMGGVGTLANETATGIVSLIEEGTAVSSMRALTLEYTGLHDELMLMLKWGAKYVSRDQDVRVPRSDDGWAWHEIDHRAIVDEYGIELMGTRNLAHKNEMVKRMLQVLPMLMNNPQVPGQKELLQQTLEKLGVFTNLDAILGPGVGQGQPIQLPGQVSPGAGLGGAATLANETQAVAGALPAAAPVGV